MGNGNEDSVYDVSRRTAIKLIASGFVAAGAGSAAAAEPTELQETAEEQAAREAGRDPDDQVVVDEALSTVDALDEQFYQATVLDTGVLTTSEVWLDEDGEPVDSETARERAREAYRAEHGALSRRLADRVGDSDDATIEIAVWTDEVDHAAARRDARAAVDANVDAAPGVGPPADTPGEVPEHARELRRERRAAVRERIDDQTSRLGRRLRSIGGVEVKSEGEGAPIVKAEATPEAVERLADLDMVWKVFEREGREPVEDLDDATVAHGTYEGRNDEFNGDGYKVGVHEPFSLVPDQVENDDGDVVDSNVDLADHHPDATGANEGGHGWLVGMAAACVDDSLPGLAKGADVYSSVFQATSYTELEIDDVMPWYEDNDVPVVNESWSRTDGYGRPPDRLVTVHDLERDAQIASRGIQLVTSAGNVNPNSPTTKFVGINARTFNGLTVGGIQEGPDPADPSTEEHAVSFDNNPERFGAAWVNPRSEADDAFQKPEVVADATQVEFPEPAGTQASGTSFSSPMVAGLISLLGKFADDDADTHPLIHEPEVSKAVVMAAGEDAGEHDPESMGTGTIRGPNAREVVQNGWYLPGTYDEADDNVTHTVSVEAGETVTMVLNWLSLPEGAGWEDDANARADVNLDLVVSHDGDVVATGTNPVQSNQWVRFQAPATGTYDVTVSKADWEHDSDDAREYCLAWHRATDDVAPEPVPDVHVYDRSPTTLSVNWDHAADAGGGGVATYEIEVSEALGAVATKQVPAPRNTATIRELSPGTLYSVTVTAVDRAGNAAQSTSLDVLTPPEPLLVNDYDGDANWPDENDLGENIATFSLDDAYVEDEVLHVDYPSYGFYRTFVYDDVSEYSQLSLRVRGQQGGEDEHFGVQLSYENADGETETVLLDRVGDHAVDTEFSRIAYDLTPYEEEATSAEYVTLNWYKGEAVHGFVEIDEITFEGRDGIEPLLVCPFEEEPPQNHVAGDDLDLSYGDGAYRDDGLFEMEAGAEFVGIEEEVGVFLAEWTLDRDVTTHHALQMTVEEGGLKDSFALWCSSVDLVRRDLPTEASRIQLPMKVFKENADPVSDLAVEPSIYTSVPGNYLAFGDVRFVGPDPLVVNDYDGDANWPAENDLGELIAYSNIDASLSDGTLRLEYDGSGLYEEGVNRDLTEHDELHVRIRGDAGGEESDLRVWIGQDIQALDDLTDQTVETHFTTLRIPLDAWDEDDLEDVSTFSLFVKPGAGTGAVEVDRMSFYGGRGDVQRRPLPAVSDHPPATATITVGESRDLEAEVTFSESPIEEYEWFIGPGFPSEDQTYTTHTGESITHTFDQPGSVGVTLRAEDADGVSGYYQLDGWPVEVPPTAAFDWSPDSPAPGETVSFDASASDPGRENDSIESYEWEFDDGTTATGEVVEHAFAEAGSYDVTLTVTDNNDLEDDTTETVDV